MDHKLLGKRMLAFTVALLVLSIFAWAGGQGESGAADGGTEGTTIAVALRSLPETDYFIPRIPEFEEATGIEVRIVQYPEQQLRDKIVEDISSGAGQFDIVALDSFSLPQFVAAGWLLPLDTVISSDRWEAADVDDFSAGVLQLLSSGEHLYALPIYAETSQLMYRKDLFDAADMQPPETMEELIAAAEYFTDRDNDQYGIAMRGLRGFGMNMYIFAGFLHAYGGDFFTEDYRAAFSNAAGLEAGEVYVDLLANYGPPGQANFSWDDVQNAFTSGTTAMIIDANNFYTRIEDPEKSTIHGKIGYTTVPEGPFGAYPSIYSLGMGISSEGAHTEAEQQAAAEFLLWATSYEMQVGQIEAGIVSQTRDRVLTSREFAAAADTEWLSSTAESWQIVNGNYLPPSEAYPPVGDMLGVALQSAISGQRSVGEAFQAAREEAEEYLKQVNLYGTRTPFQTLF